MGIAPEKKTLASDKPKIVKAYQDAGYIVMPLKGKQPIIKKWTTLKENPYSPEYYANKNFGFVIPPEIIVVDVDPRNFIDKDNPLYRLVKDTSLSTDTYTVKTGGGGFHLYFKNPTGVKVVNSLPEYLGIEFKSQGKQVVCPGSLHPDTNKPYSIIKKSIGEIEVISDKLLRLIVVDKAQKIDKNERADKSATPKQTSALDTALILDRDGDVKRFISYLINTAPLAIEGEQGDHTTFKVACVGKDLGLTAARTLAEMVEHWNVRCTPPWSSKELATKVKNAFAYGQEKAGVLSSATLEFDDIQAEDSKGASLKWDVNDNGVLKKTLSNTVNFFNFPDSPLVKLVKFNRFSGNIEFIKDPPWRSIAYTANKMWMDDDTTLCRYFLSAKHHYDIHPSIIWEAVLVESRRYGYHPIQEYLENLVWDGKPRLGDWLVKYLGCPDNKYVRSIGSMVLVAAVSRVMHPGCKWDYMLVLEGKQGTYKSSVVHALGGKWYSDLNISPHDKDTIDALRGRWIVELSEMECTNRADVSALKAFISRQTDRCRLPYARSTDDYPRQCIFIGTINPEAKGYLRDVTGNRRFLPVKCGKIKINELSEDRNQLFAEAFLHYELGEPLYITDQSIIRFAEKEAESRRVLDPWTEIIAEWLEVPLEDGTIREYTTVQEVAVVGLGHHVSKVSSVIGSRIANILRNELGWSQGTKYDEALGRNIYGYFRPKRSLV